jgi:KDO2-lipid IV(A) lauroyltransferase
MAGLARRLRHDLVHAVATALLAGTRRGSLPGLRRLGRSAARLTVALNTRQRALARANIAAAFPDRNAAWQDELLRRSIAHFGDLLGEVLWLAHASEEEILEHSHFEGLSHLLDNARPPDGAILVTGHCGNWEWLGLALGASRVPMTAAAREVYDPRLDDVVMRLRGRFGTETVLRGPNAGRRLAAALSEGRVLGLLIDQDIDVPGAFVEFFARPAWTPTGAAVLALRRRSPVVTGFALREPDGSFRIRFEPVELPPPGGKLKEQAARLTALCTARTETAIRECPEQWVWMHRRWRRQPGADERVWRPGS